MPVHFTSEYKPSFFFRNSDFNTIYPSIFRKFKNFKYTRERIHTADHDFIDIDISSVKSKTAAILCHGLEGHSQRHYMVGMARALNEIQVDAVSFNFRGCSGEINKKHYAYHSGFTEDLHTVIQSIQNKYSSLYLIGFSLGGNLILKYLGENKFPIPGKLKRAFVFSVPCDLGSASQKIIQARNFIYNKRFVHKLLKKIRKKLPFFPEIIQKPSRMKIKTIKDFDTYYTAPFFGYKNAADYYKKNSSRYFIKNIKTPTVIISSMDDPLLSEDCFPFSEAKRNPNVKLTVSQYGGHMGYVMKGKKETWLELKAVEMIKQDRRK